MSGGQFYRVFPSLCVAGGAARYWLLLLLALHLSSRGCWLGTRQSRQGRGRPVQTPHASPCARHGSKVSLALSRPRGACLDPRPTPSQAPTALCRALASSPVAGAGAADYAGLLLSWVCLGHF